MRYVAAVSICALYFAGVLATVPIAGPTFAWIFIAIWSAGFAWAYLAFSHGHASIAIVVVIVVTIVLPLAALIATTWPQYELLWPALQDRGARRALEFFAPVIAALFCIMLTRRIRSNVANH